ncbi:MAG: hypothetical protein JWN66_4128 [Sphingomonas bacterium]|jgi:anti-sigma factor RsiW|uniref:zf-HC2 domain-containing protein n=1 Tax=Sphingomonas bacterium TaxID=1895847 RepID=UPI002604BEF4|nr:zf-HC2 domain-containing protein [Sphingomonas bacterium]MDB5707012.1 hypothetical protein [Sphingomonas bacterium]
MSHIVHLHGDPHEQTQALLPWYVSGTLDLAEAAMVEAHLAECADCRAELKSDRVLGVQVASLSMDVEQGWAALRQKVSAAPPQRPAAGLSFLRRPVAIGWAFAGQLAAAALVLALAFSLRAAPDGQVYRALGSAPVSTPGNVVVLFQPDISGRDMRVALVRSGARVVDGPTASGAYILRVAEKDRSAALDRLRATHQVLLAEPVDAGAQP